MSGKHTLVFYSLSYSILDHKWACLLAHPRSGKPHKRVKKAEKEGGAKVAGRTLLHVDIYVNTLIHVN